MLKIQNPISNYFRLHISFKVHVIFININHIVVQSLSCVQLFCHPMDCNLPGSSIHGIFQARILERVATSFSGIREGLPLPKSGIKPTSPIWQVDSLPLTHQGSPINHMFFHNSKVNKLQRLEITPNIIFEHRRLNYKSKTKK